MTRNKHKKEQVGKRRWSGIERALLVLTFICTASATLYSVRTARRALEQASIELRPWISVTRLETFREPDHLETRFEILNIGKTPAYLDIESHAYRDGNAVPQSGEEQRERLNVIMPGQKIYYKGFGRKGELYESLLKGVFEEQVTQSITVKYDTNKENVKRYRTYLKLRFDASDLSDSIKGGSEFGAWDIVEGDFD
ncbi:MAG: hypothetical protein AMJ75_05390 [Phycisphaerae bacterium SM1_79]|nr:MAG: hypothetical protein AMJ75_05390 [Phycisphaerae bacterium SM1_79]